MNRLLPTIGPITASEKNLRKILKISNLVRLNGAHNDLIWHKKISYRIKKINSNAKILLDLPGVKPRTNNKKVCNIKKNQKIIFFYKKCKQKNITKIEITAPIPKIYKKINYLSVSDGNYPFKIIKLNKNYIIAKSLENFDLMPKKGVNIPNSIYSEKIQRKKYINFLKKAKNIKFDAVGLSYVQTPKIVNEIKRYKDVVIVSKIENIEGLNNINEISKVSDVIMVDRGDLAAEIGEHKLFSAINSISNVTKNNGKSLIIATENLESMIFRKNSKNPTKSEIISLGYAKSLRADRIMLSDETATSPNWKNIINWLDRFLKTKDSVKLKTNIVKAEIFWNVVQGIEGIPIIIFSRKGYAIDKIRQINDNTNLTVFTDSIKTKSLCEFKANTFCCLIKRFAKNKNSSFIYNTIKKYKKKIFKKQNIAALIYISYPRKNSRANTLSLISKKDF